MINLTAIGNVGRDARVTEVNGRKAVNFSICHNHKVKGKDGVQTEKSTWINCTYWREGSQSTEVATFLKKGTKVFVTGFPDVEIYKDSESRPACALNLRVGSLELVGTKTDTQKEASEAPYQDTDQGTENASAEQIGNDASEDDLPF